MSNTVEIDFDDLRHQTDSAYLLIIDEEEVWIPKECSHVDTKAQVATIPEKLALEKGLI